MAINSAVTLPAQPAAGLTTFVPLGGTGTLSPLGYFLVELDLVGDAGGGNASLTINGDPRYTNQFAFVNLKIDVATAAAEFVVSMRLNTAVILNQIQVNGTMPLIDITQPTSSFVWVPPPMLWETAGALSFVTPNVAATETYRLFTQVMVWDKNVTHQTPYGYIAQSFPGVSPPPVA